MGNVRISIIGAGSGQFTLGLIGDICLTPNLRGSTVSLMDVNEDRLKDAHTLCLRLVEELGVPLTLETTRDRRQSLRGAHFVIVTALVDGARRMREGWAIAEKHGVKWGGSYHILYDEPFWLNFYQLQLFESIAQDMLQVCPSAWLLLVSNPVAAGTTFLTRKYPALKMVGLCHGYAGVYEIADALGLDRGHLTYEIPGINHFVWLTRLYHNGEDVLPMVDRWLETEAEHYWQSHPEGTLGRKKMDLYRKLGAIPIGDTASVTGASWPWWYHSHPDVERRWGTDSREWWQGYLDHLSRAAAGLKELAQDPSRGLAARWGAEQTGEPMVPIIESICCDIPRVIIGNVQNTHDFVPGLPRDFEVEIPNLVSRRGIQGIVTGGLPKGVIAHALRDRVAPIEIELEAYEQGSRALLTHLVMTDKWITSEQQANDLVDEVFALPYHGELRGALSLTPSSQRPPTSAPPCAGSPRCASASAARASVPGPTTPTPRRR